MQVINNLRTIFVLMTIILSFYKTSGQRPIGANLTDLSPYGTVWIYTNALKQSSGWLIENANDEEDEINYSSELTFELAQYFDANGYPNAVPFQTSGIPETEGLTLQTSCLVLNGQPAPWFYPSGDYLLVFEGSGQINVLGDVDGEYMEFTEEGAHEIPVSNPTALGLILQIVESMESDPIQNVQLIFPEYVETYQTQNFRADFMELVEPFDVLRFMKPQRVEHNEVEEWDGRSTTENFSYFLDIEDQILVGMPYDDIIELSNLLQIDPWVCVPHRANDLYVEQMAFLFNRDLDDERQLYLEYTNEGWNPSYPQKWQYMLDQGMALGLPTSENEEVAESQAIHWYFARRMFEIFEIFEEEFDNDDQIVKIHGTQSDPFVANLVLESYGLNSVNPNNMMPDAIAPASYIGVYMFNDLAEQNLDVCDHTALELLDTLVNRIGWEMEEGLRRYTEITNDLGIDLFAYEGGQHVTEINFQAMEPCAEGRVAQMNNLPEMEDFICELMASWYDDFDGDLFVFFNLAERPDAFGSFGLLETQWQMTDDSPKWQGLEACVFESDEEVTGIKLNELSGFIYPNPVSNGVVNIELGQEKNGIFLIADLSGKTVFQKVIKRENQSILLPNHITPGLYISTLIQDKSRKEQKLIIR